MKESILCLLKILEEWTDDDNLLSQPDVLKKMDDIYDLKIDRRTLYSHVVSLQDLGYDIETYSENGKGYRLKKRLFEPSEAFLLASVVHGSNLISKKESNELIEKLFSTQSHYFKENYNQMIRLENDEKIENKQFFYSIEVLCGAIKNKKSVSFDYLHYNVHKKLVNRRDNPSVVSPYYLIVKGDKVYLVGKSSHYNDFTHYRLDRMKNVRISDEPYILLNSEDPYVYAKSKINMFSGEVKSIAIRCDYEILDYIIENFGRNITIIDNGDSFTAYVQSSIQGMVIFALQYIQHLEVLEPQELRDEIRKALEEGIKKY